MPLADYDYALPPEAIAQAPPPDRDGGRLLTLCRTTGERTHQRVRDLPELLEPDDLLVTNVSRVDRARLRGRKETGGQAEALLLGREGDGRYAALVRARGRLRPGQKFCFERGQARLEAELIEHREDGRVVLAFDSGADPYALGEMPLPPYIRRDAADPQDDERYQTVYARTPGSVAAPTAGLHLGPGLLAAIERRGVRRAEVTLHVGAGTFRPVTDADLARGALHPERFELPPETATAIAETRRRGGRVVAVGTTTTRVLEHAADGHGGVTAGSGETRLFLQPGARFQVIDALWTNFHLPRSSLLMLVAAFAGRDAVLSAYRDAVAAGYRFYSYGDAMWIH